MMLSVALHHRFAGFTLDVRFDAPPGLTVLFGRSGAGKSTVVQAVAGLLRPDQGRVAVADMVLTDTARGVFLPPHRRRLGYVFQDSRLFPHLTVRQNLLYGRWFAPRAAPAADFDRTVALLGIGPLLDRRPGALSGGERQRVALGRAFLAAPNLLLMDEPLAALDEERKAEIMPLIERLRDEARVPILYVSHSLPEVARLATTLILMDEGRVARQGPVAALLSDPAAAAALGLREAGSLLTARLAAQDADGLSRLDHPAGPIWLPRVEAAPGTPLRLRLMAQDVMLALTRPVGISALNVLPATVRDIHAGQGPGTLVQLAIGPDLVLARITRRSAEALSLTPGQQIFAVLKAVSVAPGNIGPA
ncbi:molybdenum ABC transporter ATP-binding protein [Fuscovulum blasticum]|uniref:molybdenum ABC transporter ATP-binding protein n=1 Tax=Fuscovulum blasticum TaxID=1075 RepID=UPI000D3E6A9C|nr:molybdenum ABC transporter ATP-binding protein [Fuscovulum blasticum]AWD23288.1 molybdenum ABC transporter ATP-binding protein [Fuscovulum blasticum]